MDDYDMMTACREAFELEFLPQCEITAEMENAMAAHLEEMRRPLSNEEIEQLLQF